MKKFTLILTFICGVISFALAQPPVAWQRAFPITDLLHPDILDIEQLSDGGYIIGGQIDDSYYPEGYLLIRMTREGDTLWIRRYPQYHCTGAIFVHATQDGGFYFAGSFAHSFDSWFTNVVRVDSVGSIIRSNLYTSGSLLESAYPTSDGGIILAGGYLGDFYLEKISASGASEWMRQYQGGSNNDIANSVVQTEDGGFFACGTVNYGLSGSYCYALRTDQQGVLLWGRDYQGFNGSVAGTAVQMRNNKFMIVHYNTAGVICIDAQGDTLWTKSLFVHGKLTDAISYRDNSVVVTGWKYPYALGYIARIDSIGTILWEKEPNLSFFSKFNSVCLTEDDNIVTAGVSQRNIYSPPRQEVYVHKFCSQESDAGRVICIINRDSIGCYRLCHENGSLDRLVFPNVAPGTTGSVSGTASTSWHVLQNGDGNDGDTIIFESSIPLVSGSVDTFWLTRPEIQCEVKWIAGCRKDTTHILHAEIRNPTFHGAWMMGGITIYIHTEYENHLNQIEIWSRPDTTYSGFYRIAIQTATNYSNGHIYVFPNLPCTNGSLYIYAVTDVNGCSIFSNDTLTAGVNVSMDRGVILNPSSFTLSSFPNPFNPSTTLSFTLPKSGNVRLAVYDILGREVKVLQEGIVEAGEHAVTFDGSHLSSGIYFARLESSGNVKTQKLLLLK